VILAAGQGERQPLVRRELRWRGTKRRSDICGFQVDLDVAGYGDVGQVGDQAVADIDHRGGA
jgi:hypothetical protein